MLFMGIGMPCMFVTLSTVSLSTVRREDMTASTGMYTLARRVGGNLGYALVAMLIERYSTVHQAYLSTNISPLNNTYSAYAAALTARLSRQVGDPVAVQNKVLALADTLVQRQAAMLAYNDIAWFFGVMFLGALPFVWLLSRRKIAQTARKSASSAAH
jgi:DHA2 family multidrug resistance protein